eukprot:TRINITY_DN516_c0_g1_i5.p1 TRINITY_DN516_c0_g1~~TRINITY_DN516_c0_g1_i5.p1  ORF type:complete len:154 (+),score=1.31 TRINITY_DN516_c0_g1_i5:221-682(+)
MLAVALLNLQQRCVNVFVFVFFNIFGILYLNFDINILTEGLRLFKSYIIIQRFYDCELVTIQETTLYGCWWNIVSSSLKNMQIFRQKQICTNCIFLLLMHLSWNAGELQQFFEFPAKLCGFCKLVTRGVDHNFDIMNVVHTSRPGSWFGDDFR